MSATGLSPTCRQCAGPYFQQLQCGNKNLKKYLVYIRIRMTLNTKLRLLPLLFWALVIWILTKLGKPRWVDWFLTNRFSLSPQQKMKSFDKYYPRSNDVIISTYPKSGTYWALQIALQIAYYGEIEFNSIHELVPWPDTPIPLVKAKLHNSSPNYPSPTGLRVIKTHLEQYYVPYSSHAKYIVVLRDPKEVFVSSYFFVKNFSFINLDYTLTEWLAMFLSDRFLFGSWAEHVTSWWPYRNHDNVLIVTYSEMKRNIRSIIRQMAELMEVTLTEAQIEKIVAKSSFHYMKANEIKFNSFSILGTPIPYATLIRSGNLGNSSELINATHQNTIDKYFIAELQRLKSEFPYTELFNPQKSAN